MSVWFPEIPFPFEGMVRRWFRKNPEPAPEPEQTVLLMPQPVKPLLHIGENLSRPGEELIIDPSDWANTGDRDVIFAASGFGKSYLAGVLMEEILESGALIFVIDPEGENHTLAKRYDLLIVGGDHATVNLDLDKASPKDIEKMVRTVLTNGVSVIFDLSGRTQKTQQVLFTLICGALFTAQESPQQRRPVKLVVEEARVFAPQKGTGLPKNEDGETCLSVFENIATRGRKRGINLLLATQRPASVSKDIISQCNRWWFGGMESTQDCNALKPYLEEADVTAEDIKNLPKGKGQFYFSSNGTTQQIQVRTRKCEHGGSTPVIQPENLKRASRSEVRDTAKALEAIQNTEDED